MTAGSAGLVFTGRGLLGFGLIAGPSGTPIAAGGVGLPNIARVRSSRKPAAFAWGVMAKPIVPAMPSARIIRRVMAEPPVRALPGCVALVRVSATIDRIRRPHPSNEARAGKFDLFVASSLRRPQAGGCGRCVHDCARALAGVAAWV
ncbi:hypothetical protein BOSE62_71113 [Bosea sp. 62]|nr:hypothetical protein BOSE21B_90527 [Bosea sp. 21B]CAD5297019.1 hypothetical protein BOSE46_80612 [Bosea sp. 46]CAD5297100.1 hypothetical protein BOSE7B_60139 [Bosea sp. 7B]VVT61173.1 hypothetical protein BOS5A_230450 [Bosea sp. EC-HK365B]VXB18069.1 hypothetical protein BOSE125_130136 [Bosea sp. 125]VXB25774.1 hypothetical protein BOSE127_110138 [Bosea sp. 127]VXC86689.1 hypothetical protein BOSE62_71113 [Bosea sp. 62]